MWLCTVPACGTMPLSEVRTQVTRDAVFSMEGTLECRYIYSHFAEAVFCDASCYCSFFFSVFQSSQVVILFINSFLFFGNLLIFTNGRQVPFLPFLQLDHLDQVPLSSCFATCNWHVSICKLTGQSTLSTWILEHLIHTSVGLLVLVSTSPRQSPYLIWHHCSLNEHAHCRCSLQMEQSGEKGRSKNHTGAAHSTGMLLQLWEQEGQLKTTWMECEEEIQMTTMPDYHHLTEDTW